MVDILQNPRQFGHGRLSHRSPSITLLQSRLSTPSQTPWQAVPLTTHSLTIDSQNSCLLGIDRPRSARDTFSHNNYDHVVPRAGGQLPLDVALPMHCLDTDAPTRCQPRACRRVPVSASRFILPAHRACPRGSPLVCSNHPASIVPIPPSSSQMPVLRSRIVSLPPLSTLFMTARLVCRRHLAARLVSPSRQSPSMNLLLHPLYRPTSSAHCMECDAGRSLRRIPVIPLADALI